MTRAEFEHIIAFCIRMQFGDGIRSKQPSWVIMNYQDCGYGSLTNEAQILYELYMCKYAVDEIHFEDE